MAQPIILTVDDEPLVLNAIERDLRQQYRRDYRILKANSGSEALEAVRQLKQRNDPITLFLADQRMPEMSGTEFLDKARKLYPEARKVLLTAYADTEAAIASINTIGLDYYLMKPWDPPDQHLYPILDDLLDDWAATVTLPDNTIVTTNLISTLDQHNMTVDGLKEAVLKKLALTGKGPQHVTVYPPGNKKGDTAYGTGSTMGDVDTALTAAQLKEPYHVVVA